MADLVERLLTEANAMHLAPSGERVGDSFHAQNWSDKPHRVLYDAVALMREAADRIAALEAEASKGERRGLERVLNMQAPIDAMCMTYRHDFGLPNYGNGISGMTERDRDALRLTMRQIWEHAVLHAVRALIPEAPAQRELGSAETNQLSTPKVGIPEAPVREAE